MKTKNLLALIFALIFTFTSALPAFAGEGELFPEQGEETVQQPEGEPAEDNLEPELDPDPGEEPPPVLPEPPDEGEDVPPVTEETPDADDDEDPDAPQDPTDGETPDEDGELPEDEENPEDGEPAEEDEPEEDGEESPSEDEELVIDVVVPNSGRFVVNPYHMKVDTSWGESTDQIVHEPQAVISAMDFPLLVSVRAMGSAQPGSGTRFVSAPPTNDVEDKEIFLYVEFQSDPALWSGTYTDAFNQLLVTDWGNEKENVMALAPFGVGYFHLSGAATPDPETMWSHEDMVDVILTFTFSPLEVQPEPVLPEESYPEEEGFPTEDDYPVEENFPMVEDDFLTAEVFPTGEDFPAGPIISEDMEADYDW